MFNILFYLEHVEITASALISIIFVALVASIMDSCYKKLKQWGEDSYETIEIDTDKKCINFDKSVQFSFENIDHVELLELVPSNKIFVKWYYPIVRASMNFYLKNGQLQKFQFHNAFMLMSVIKLLRNSDIDVKSSEFENRHKNDIHLIYIYAAILFLLLVHILFKILII